MARRLIISPRSLRDLQDIAEHIGASSPRYAAATIRNILGVLAHAKKFPQIGRVVPELDSADMRELLAYRYRIIYRVRDDADVVELVAVIHGARDLRRALHGRTP